MVSRFWLLKQAPGVSRSSVPWARDSANSPGNSTRSYRYPSGWERRGTRGGLHARRVVIMQAGSAGDSTDESNRIPLASARVPDLEHDRRRSAVGYPDNPQMAKGIRFHSRAGRLLEMREHR